MNRLRIVRAMARAYRLSPWMLSLPIRRNVVSHERAQCPTPRGNAMLCIFLWADRSSRCSTPCPYQSSPISRVGNGDGTIAETVKALKVTCG
jgi:hypothetical protein